MFRENPNIESRLKPEDIIIDHILSIKNNVKTCLTLYKIKSAILYE